METTIPRFQAQVMNLQREKEEGTRKIKRLLQLATSLERSLDTEDQTPEQKGFFLVLPASGSGRRGIRSLGGLSGGGER
jgi:hypothetical protein